MTCATPTPPSPYRPASIPRSSVSASATPPSRSPWTPTRTPSPPCRRRQRRRSRGWCSPRARRSSRSCLRDRRALRPAGRAAPRARSPAVGRDRGAGRGGAGRRGRRPAPGDRHSRERAGRLAARSKRSRMRAIVSMPPRPAMQMRADAALRALGEQRDLTVGEAGRAQAQRPEAQLRLAERQLRLKGTGERPRGGLDVAASRPAAGALGQGRKLGQGRRRHLLQRGRARYATAACGRRGPSSGGSESRRPTAVRRGMRTRPPQAGQRARVRRPARVRSSSVFSRKRPGPCGQ